MASPPIFNCTEACPREIRITKAIGEVKKVRVISARDMSRKERRIYISYFSQDVPYQSLMKSFLADRIDEELRGAARRKVS